MNETMKLYWFIVLQSLVAGAAGQASVNERSILLEFYEATGGNAWTSNYGWAEKLPDICSWYGVICNEQDLKNKERRRMDGETEGQVLGLELKSNFLTGRTPSSLWTLPKLKNVDFSYNPHLDVSFVGLQADTSGSSPLQVLLLRNTATTSVAGLEGASETMQLLHLSQNELNSKIPTELYSLTRLTSLELAECGLVGSIPDDIHRLSLLHDLNLYNNDLTGTLPSGMSRLIHIRKLMMGFNQFHGALPDYMNDFLLLQELWLPNNDFTGSIPSFSQSPELKKLYLNGNSFGGAIPEDFITALLGGPKNFQVEINLAGNEFKGTIPDSLDNLASLNILWMIGDNEWTSVPLSVCDNVKWNDGAINDFGCDGFLCPPGTFNRHGFQYQDVACQPCKSADYYGATNCYDKDDHSVLVELYVDLKGEKWERSDNWLQSGDFCTWYGVQCWDLGDSKDGRVRKILLPNNNLEGTVPETIYGMLHLTTVDFSRNDIVLPFNNIGQSQHIFSINVAGTRTKDFDGIYQASPFFQELYASQTPISGTIPSELFGLTNLKILSLMECDLSGGLPSDIFKLVKLQELYLSNNNLGGSLPDRWGELSNLEILALAKNQFIGPIPSSFDLASHLHALSLQDQVTKGGGLTGALHPLSTITNLRTLFLSDNKLEGDLPEDFLVSVEGDLPVTVDLANNRITGKVYGTFDRFQHMNLYLEGNLITEVDEHLCHQADWMLGSVGAFGCDAILCPAGTAGGRRQFTDSTCEVCTDADVSGYLGQYTCGKQSTVGSSEREILELIYEKCGGVGWHASQAWNSDKNICDWYGIDCDENGSVTSIQLGSNQLVGSFPTEVYLLPNLVHLKLYGNTLTFSFDGIENAKRLETLGLDKIGLSSLDGVGRARSIVELTVASNNLVGSIPEEVSRLVNLRNFDVSRNAISGFLPFWLRGMVSLTTFSASHNKFSGPLYDFATLKYLVYLDLSYNQLTGPVPSNLLGSVSPFDKVVADLSHNKLTGTIPSDLSRLSKLSLQVQANRVTGIEDALCQSQGWNDNEVKDFGCDGILCPAGTWNQRGRQSNEGSPCQPCRGAKYMGTTTCNSSDASIQVLGLWAVGLISWLLLV